MKWSERLAESFIMRHPGSVTHDEYMTKNDWNCEQGVVLEAFRQMYIKIGEKKYFNFIKANIDQFVTGEGKILEYYYNTFNLNNVLKAGNYYFYIEKHELKNIKLLPTL